MKKIQILKKELNKKIQNSKISNNYSFFISYIYFAFILRKKYLMRTIPIFLWGQNFLLLPLYK